MEINRKAEKAAAILAFAGSAGYLLRFIYHYTYYVIKIKYSESFFYGLIPCLLIAFYGVTLLMNKKRKPALPGIAVCAVTVFSFAVALTGSMDKPDAASVIVISEGVVFSLLYLLTFIGKIRSRIPVCILTCVGTVIYCIMFIVTCYVYIPSGDPPVSYYGIIGSVAGLTLFYFSVTVSAFSLKMNKAAEDE